MKRTFYLHPVNHQQNPSTLNERPNGQSLASDPSSCVKCLTVCVWTGDVSGQKRKPAAPECVGGHLDEGSVENVQPTRALLQTRRGRLDPDTQPQVTLLTRRHLDLDPTCVAELSKSSGLRC